MSMKVDAFGVPSIVQQIRPSPVPPGYSTTPPTGGATTVPFNPGFGFPALVQDIHPASFGPGRGFGTPAITFFGQILPTSLVKTERFGTPKVQNLSKDYRGVLFTPWRNASFIFPDTHYELLEPVPMPGRTFGRNGVNPPGLHAAQLPPAVVGAKWKSGGRNPPGGHVSTSQPASAEDLTIGRNWFNRIHVMPRTPINFGRFVTPVSATYEVFSAFRGAINLVGVTDTSDAGLTLEDLPALPALVLPFTSILDPSSQRFAPVKLTVTAQRAGAEEF